MANILYDSLINPVRFYERNPVTPVQYFTKWFDTWQFCKTIRSWEEKVCFFQQWGQDDSVRLQYTSNFNPIVIRLYNEAGNLILQQNCNTFQQDEYRPAFYIRQAEIDLSPYPPGYYFFTREAAGVVTYSDPFEILENISDTVLIEYNNDEPYEGVKFFAPFSPMLRVPAILKYEKTIAQRVIYFDQRYNATNVHTVNMRLWSFILCGKVGGPPWLLDKVSRIFGCRTLKLDGRLYTVNDGAEWETVEVEGYPLMSQNIEVVESLNRSELITENETVIQGTVVGALIMDNYKAVGLGDNSGNDYQEINFVQ